MRILGIDPGSSSGFAYGEPGDKPRSGTVRLDSKSANGRRFCLLEGRVRNLISVYELDAIVLEMPYIQTDPKKFDINVARLGYGYQAAILMAADKEGIGPENIHLVTADSWRSTVLGCTRAPKGSTEDNRTWLKKRAISACDQRRWPIKSEDEAEACLIWEYGCEIIKPASTLDRLPLFQQLSL